ncbi:MAG: methyltransferase domain-containing protein [Marmoricola sp.]|nr:methyltransferase domain-containing protein [Marmoricola sp.]
MDHADERPRSFGRSFGRAAAAYAEHRPDYAAEAVRWALELAPGRRVLDLGAGTGKLTGTLVAAALEVTAVEPDEAMLEELRACVPDAVALEGTAEAVPMAAGSVDAVLAGNALHWFDMRVAGPEIARVLAPDGVLAGLWNVVDDQAPWVAELARVAGPEAIGPRDTPGGWRTATADLLAPAAADETLFGDEQRAEFAHAQRRTADSLTATLATRAGMLVMTPPERAARLDRIRRFLHSRPETGEGEFDLPMLTCVLRARRMPRSGSPQAHSLTSRG